jgi:hypothetical protein
MVTNVLPEALEWINGEIRNSVPIEYKSCVFTILTNRTAKVAWEFNVFPKNAGNVVNFQKERPRVAGPYKKHQKS